MADGIYTCVDSKGRKLTSDRPILECIDRTQQVLSTSGWVKRKIGPSLTAHEDAEQEEKTKLQELALAHEAEKKRRDRVLVLRYPNPEAHNKERFAALAQIDEIIDASNKRKRELLEQRQSIAGELEFYAKDRSKTPAALKRKKEDNDNSLSVQQKFVQDQAQEKIRISQRFDEELLKLRQLWAPSAAPPGAAGSGGKNGLSTGG
ncbi:hypothetical protein AwPolaro_10270 [Polaromonas sp.]|nr:hypothetical protein AwPolaro_10270 [Polaromonas sp.]